MERKNKKNVEYVAVESFEIRRATDTGRAVFFDATINGVTIYGLRVVDGERGDFIGFPAKQGKDGKYYHVAYIPLSTDDQNRIIDAVAGML